MTTPSHNPAQPTDQKPVDGSALDVECAFAAEKIEQLDSLVGRVDGARVQASDVFRVAIEGIESLPAHAATLYRNVAGKRTNLLSGKPEVVDTDHSQGCWQHSYKLTDQESIELTVTCDSPADEFPYRGEFYRSVLECCAVAFLKERYRIAAFSGEKNLIRTPTFQKVFAVAILSAMLVLAMMIPVRFRLPVEGVITAAQSREVFAPVAGTLNSILVRDGQSVEVGDALAMIDQPEIQLQHDRLHGELLTAKTELAAARVDRNRPSASGTNRPVIAHTAVIQARVRSLEKQTQLIDQIHESLTIRC